MKKNILILVCCLSCCFCYAQDFTGIWEGDLEVQNTKIPLVFKIKKDSVYTSTMDSPDQGAKDVLVDVTTVKGSVVTFSIKNSGIFYEGKIENDSLISGTFKQGVAILPLDLIKKKDKSKRVNRPQEPIPPHSYKNEDVTFKNKQGVKFSGTLSLPNKIDGIFPAVILISGSGPQNRDSELFGHKPFLVIADYLVKREIAVLRFDDRGVGLSKGNHNTATTLDFADDVEAAFSFLSKRKNIDSKKIGLIGHSEGGMIASMIASRLKNIDFIVLLATPGLQGDKILLSQSKLLLTKTGKNKEDIDKISRINKKSYRLIQKNKNVDQLKIKLVSHLNSSQKKYNFLLDKPKQINSDDYVKSLISQMISPWFTFFINYDPKNALERVKCPVLAINGKNDVQVASGKNLNAIRKALQKGKNKDYVIKELPKLNHLFQESNTGLPHEYSRIEQTFSPIALKVMGDWIETRVNKPKLDK